MVNARNKGAANERAVGRMYFDEMGVTLMRDIEQYRRSDRGDLIADGDFDFPFCIEVKSRAGVNVSYDKAWWAQVDKAAKACGKMPLLWYKYDRREWRVVMRLKDVCVAVAPASIDDSYADALLTMDADTHFYLAREILAERAAL